MSPLSFQTLFMVSSFFIFFLVSLKPVNFICIFKWPIWGTVTTSLISRERLIIIRFSTVGSHRPFLLDCQHTKSNFHVQQLIKYLFLNSLSFHSLKVIPYFLFNLWIHILLAIFNCFCGVIFPASSLPCLQTYFIFHSILSFIKFCLLLKHNFLKDCLLFPIIWV